jgi:hypothetical protein
VLQRPDSTRGPLHLRRGLIHRVAVHPTQQQAVPPFNGRPRWTPEAITPWVHSSGRHSIGLLYVPAMISRSTGDFPHVRVHPPSDTSLGEISPTLHLYMLVAFLR